MEQSIGSRFGNRGKRKKRGHQLLSMLLIAAMILTLQPPSIYATSSVLYVDETGTTRMADNVTAITSAHTALTTGWYVVNNNVSTRNLTVTGDVKVILADGKTWTADVNTEYGAGTDVGVKVLENESLTIYGQALGTGKLRSTGRNVGAGIGGGNQQNAGTITINSGTIEVASSGGAGIGGGYNGAGGTITINGGTVNVKSRNGAGIGGGDGGAAGTITITGGTVNARNVGSMDAGAGIGSGYSGAGGIIMIEGGVINIESHQGAGIGTGRSAATGGTITITGGTINAQSNEGGAGIGGGRYSDGSVITITGGTIAAQGKLGGAGIGGGELKSGGTVYISGGNVHAIGAERGAEAIGKGGSGTSSGSLQNNSTVKSPVYLTTISLRDSSSVTEAIYTLGGVADYDLKGVNPLDGKLYLYLPADTEVTSVTTTEGTYVGSVRTTSDHQAMATFKMLGTDATLSELKYQVGDGDAVTVPGFAAGTETYEIELPVDTAEDAKVTLLHVKNDANATLGDNSSDELSTNLTAGAGGVIIEVVAEDGVTTKTYTVNFTTATLETFTVTLPSGTGYTAAAAPNYSSPVIAGNMFMFFVQLEPEYNQSRITVKANGTPIVPLDAAYIISSVMSDQLITVEGVTENPPVRSDDATLSALEYKVGDGDAVTVPGFAVGTETYEVELPVGTATDAKVTLVAAKNDVNATLGDNSSEELTTNLTAGAGEIIIEVVAEDGVTKKTYTVKFTTAIAPPVSYTVTYHANGGSVSQDSVITAADGKLASLLIPVRSGTYAFNGWFTAAKGGTRITTDTVFSAHSTIYAQWTYTGGGSAPSGGFTDSDSQAERDSNITIILPASDSPHSPTQGEIKVSGQVDADGNAEVTLDPADVVEALDKAMKDAQEHGSQANGIALVLRMETGGKMVSGVKVNLPKTVQDMIVSEKIVNLIVVVDQLDMSIGMNLAAVEEIHKQANSDARITAERIDSGLLSGSAQTAIGNRPAFELGVSYGQDEQVKHFGSGTLSVAVPYIRAFDEQAGNVLAVYVDESGNVQWLRGSVYDDAEHVLRFATNHLSTYGVGYKQSSTTFADIADHWAKEDVDFVAIRELFGGTSATTFDPNAAMTRGMFVTILGRLANADVSGYEHSRFTDVTGDAYYTGYVEWAAREQIVNGFEEERFAPDQSITREQMAVILLNYVKASGLTLRQVSEQRDFADSEHISDYAKLAVKQIQMAGMLSGKKDHRFDPQGTATRAELSVILRRFLELTAANGNP